MPFQLIKTFEEAGQVDAVITTRYYQVEHTDFEVGEAFLHQPGEIQVVLPKHLNNVVEKNAFTAVGYINSLQFAVQHKYQTVVFPKPLSISTVAEELRIARHTIRQFLQTEELKIFVVVENPLDLQKGSHLYEELNDYLLLQDEVSRVVATKQQKYIKGEQIDCKINFQRLLLSLIEDSRYDELKIQKRANMTLSRFLAICHEVDFELSKTNVWALAIALKLTLEEAADFLKVAGFTLSIQQKRDRILSFFIEKKHYNLFIINAALFIHNEEALG